MEVLNTVDDFKTPYIELGDVIHWKGLYYLVCNIESVYNTGKITAICLNGHGNLLGMHDSLDEFNIEFRKSTIPERATIYKEGEIVFGIFKKE